MNQATLLAPPSSRGRTVLRRAAASAPMRLSFAGGGTDLPPFVAGRPGRIVGTAIDLRVEARVEPFDPGWLRFEAPGLPGPITRRRGDPAHASVELRLLEAALARAGVEGGASIAVSTAVIPGAGLGGSASASVALLSALASALGDDASLDGLALGAIELERDDLHVTCGAQDQEFAARGGFRDLSFDERGCVAGAAIEPPAALVRELGDGVLLVDTLVRRVSSDVLHRVDLRAHLESTAELVAAAGDVADALSRGSLSGVLAGMRRSAVAKLRRDPVGSRPALELARRLEGLGAEVVRVCGAGGGGHVLVWARPSHHEGILAALPPGCVRRPRLAAEGVRLEHRAPAR